eukprot:gnl/TRDRNA2_/TRDRNA2_156479_c0_seq4.p1 gnl/TRDRNA2_/TRDRNA2_156479_c0~~gnl/TRDRNA2_/TRDRNA2_156479_c0_seq4.p1  ORF type:complete len:182 (+),score=17.84 gnl/TRDRNA2_/TRDRNA2_156479_c0_seq4:71-616(+)
MQHRGDGDGLLAAVGTLNPGKLQACEMCISEWPDLRYKVSGVSAASGVSEQPMGLEETTLGAKNRAQNALQSLEGASVGIGLESGLVVVDGMHLDFCACAVFDGTRHYLGLSSGWVLPPQVTWHLHSHQVRPQKDLQWRLRRHSPKKATIRRSKTSGFRPTIVARECSGSFLVGCCRDRSR